MSRPPDTERIFAAKKAATIERLVGDGIARSDAVAWVESWEGGAAASTTSAAIRRSGTTAIDTPGASTTLAIDRRRLRTSRATNATRVCSADSYGHPSHRRVARSDRMSVASSSGISWCRS
jgi:hypothetical protein